VSLKLSPRVSVFRYNLTQSQNLKATVGYDFTSDLTAPFTKVRRCRPIAARALVFPSMSR
jgi:hypothetical protein